jgi:hypothetical protein
MIIVAMRLPQLQSLAARAKGGVRTGGASAIILFLFSGSFPSKAQETNVDQEVRELRIQNGLLQQQVQQQGAALDVLSNKVTRLETAEAERSAHEQANSTSRGPKSAGLNLGNVHLGVEGGLAIFNTGSEGFAPESEFRVDEARLFVEAPVWKEVYFYGDVDLATHENPDLKLYLNELYLDFQDVSQLWGRDNQLNFRAGRMDIPFGEEYQRRFAIDDPLISHSLPDIWGVDPGVEIYGSFQNLSYVVAVQNGGVTGVNDSTGDKSVAGRIGYDPNAWLHVSASAMRTGDESVSGDYLSAIWFGNTFFQNLGSPGTTKFHANLVEGDFTVRWPKGYLAADGGYAHYGDNDPLGNNRRDIYYYAAELEQDLPRKFYAATRFSQILCAGGIPILGFGNGSYSGGTPTTELWRLSLGLGYRFSNHLVVKTEYAFERGHEFAGGNRNHEDLFGAEIAFKF